MEIKCYSDGDSMIIAISRVDQNLQDPEDMQTIVEKIIHETCLSAFLSKTPLPDSH